MEAAFVPSLRCQIIDSAQESKLMSIFSLKDEDPHDLMRPLVTKAVTAMPSCSEAGGS